MTVNWTLYKPLVNANITDMEKAMSHLMNWPVCNPSKFNLENEKIELQKNVSENQSNLILLMGDTIAGRLNGHECFRIRSISIPLY